jgi:hypothetical protein
MSEREENSSWMIQLCSRNWENCPSDGHKGVAMFGFLNDHAGYKRSAHGGATI